MLASNPSIMLNLKGISALNSATICLFSEDSTRIAHASSTEKAASLRECPLAPNVALEDEPDQSPGRRPQLVGVP